MFATVPVRHVVKIIVPMGVTYLDHANAPKAAPVVAIQQAPHAVMKSAKTDAIKKANAYVPVIVLTDVMNAVFANAKMIALMVAIHTVYANVLQGALMVATIPVVNAYAKQCVQPTCVLILVSHAYAQRHV